MQALSEFLVEYSERDLSSISDAYHFKDLKQLARELPPFNKIAFEFELKGKQKLDFHVNINQNDNLPLLIRAFKENELCRHKEWLSFIDILEEWGIHGNEINKHIEGFYLEFDSSKNVGLSLPSVFTKITSKYNKEEAWSIANKIIKKLKGEYFFETNKAIIYNSIFNAPEKSYLGYIGLMLSRPEEAIRLNIHHIQREDLILFLQKNGWLGNEQKLMHYYDLLCLSSDKVIVSFDAYKNVIMPRIGFEAFNDYLPKQDPRWHFLLDSLRDEQLCDEEKKALIFEWDKIFQPLIGEKWHETLVLNSLLQPKYSFSILKQVLSHIKITIEENSVKAKAYLGFGQTWINDEKVKNNNFQAKHSIESSIDYCLNFILSEQQQSGFWRDYIYCVGTSDQWVSAYVADAISNTNNKKALRASKKAWEAIKYTFRKEEGWGFNFLMTADADSTAWCLILAKREDPSFYEQNKKVLEKFLAEDGSVITYVDQEGIRKWALLEPNTNLDGWMYKNDCVSAAVAQILPEKVIPRLIEKQKENGLWTSYWWSSDIYATTYTLIALNKNKTEIPFKEKIERWMNSKTLSFLSEIQEGKNVNVYQLSLLIIACLELNIKNHLNLLVEHVLKQQLSNGSWAGCSELTTPFPNVTVVKSENDYHVQNDRNNLLTSATVLKMLVQFARESK